MDDQKIIRELIDIILHMSDAASTHNVFDDIDFLNRVAKTVLEAEILLLNRKVEHDRQQKS